MQLPKIGWANLDGAGESAPAMHGPSVWRLQLVDALLAGPGDRLVGADDHAAHPGGVVQRLERDDHLDRRAVGVGDDPLVLEDVVRVDLGDDQRHLGLHPEGARVVDDDRTGRGRDRAPLARDARPACSTARSRRPRTPRRERARIGWLSPRNVTVLPALRSEARNLIDAIGKSPLLEQADHPLAHGPTGPDDGHVLHDPAPASRRLVRDGKSSRRSRPVYIIRSGPRESAEPEIDRRRIANCPSEAVAWLRIVVESRRGADRSPGMGAGALKVLVDRQGGA